jgi:hypothetical protein
MKWKRHMKHARWFRAIGLAVITSTVSLALAAQAGDPKDMLLRKLKEQFIPTEFSRDLTEITTTGAVVALQKDGLLVYGFPANTYPISAFMSVDKSIKFKYAGLFLHSSNACKIDGVTLPNGCNTLSTKTLMAGGKVWIYDISFRKKEISVIVATDPYDGERYIGELWLPFEKDHLPTLDEAVKMISEVLVVQPTQDQAAKTVPVSPPPPPPPTQRVYEDVAPPPPPPAPAATISMGQTKAQVTAAFGEPQRKAAAGPKEIFFYTDLKMKVTFTNGKVSSID